MLEEKLKEFRGDIFSENDELRNEFAEVSKNFRGVTWSKILMFGLNIFDRVIVFRGVIVIEVFKEPWCEIFDVWTTSNSGREIRLHGGWYFNEISSFQES